MSEPLYLEDLFVDQRFRGGPLEVTTEEIKAFAAKFDPQPFHLDETAAKDSLFGQLVASGWHTASLTMRLLTQCASFSGGLIGVGGKVEWLRPVLPGDLLSVEATILRISPSKSRDDRGMVKMRVVTSNQRGETVQLLDASVLAFRRPAGP
ncbi:MaoC family dehydratase [Methylosinus sp. C49]|jgi:acyl dehydratase|uniref:MaoC family dehydratase n=1 Tax=Methylosinus sp. C49 TaxID=2699395 RepID=UPI00136685CF|nr:MaoC family dehydratase [Methylosinus sp. C49]BBU62673.1 MaoC family dehydratase [Methylosinus sp. C49]